MGAPDQGREVRVANVSDSSGNEPTPSASPVPLASATSTAPNPSGPASQSAEPKGTKPGGIKRVVEWFWLGSAIRRLRTDASRLSPRGQELLRRARLASELAVRAIEPAEAFASGPADVLACELYREAVYWSLLGQRELGEAPSAEAEIPALGIVTPALWACADRETLSRAAGSPTRLEEVRSRVVDQSFATYAELPSTEQAQLARSLRPFVDGLIGALDVVQRKLERLWFARLLRLGLLGAALVVLFFVIRGFADWSERRNNLASGAQWEASSKYPEGGCATPEQSCSTSPNFFFHTYEEEDPWIRFDFGAVKKLSGVTIKNRLDCCYERAVPLIVEVSIDQKHWKEVARRTTEFSTWHEKFPTVEAHWVKIHVPRKTNLHLSEVRLLP